MGFFEDCFVTSQSVELYLTGGINVKSISHLWPFSIYTLETESMDFNLHILMIAVLRFYLYYSTLLLYSFCWIANFC